jgi:hypothetical protein
MENVMMLKNVVWIAAVLALVSASACGSGDSGSSDAVAAPSDLMAVPRDGGSHLTWKDNSGNETEFMIERKSGSGNWETIGTVPFNTTQYHDANVMSDTEYMYRVMAMSKQGTHGPASNEAHCRTGAAGDATSAGAAGSVSHMHQ